MTLELLPEGRALIEQGTEVSEGAGMGAIRPLGSSAQAGHQPAPVRLGGQGAGRAGRRGERGGRHEGSRQGKPVSQTGRQEEVVVQVKGKP